MPKKKQTPIPTPAYASAAFLGSWHGNDSPDALEHYRADHPKILIGPPKATKKYTEQQLKEGGWVGFYFPREIQ